MSSEKNRKEMVFEVAKRAVLAARAMTRVSAGEKNRALNKVADFLDEKSEDIIFRNGIDVEAAREDSLAEPLIDRLVLDAGRIKSMTDGIREVAELEDPVGEIIQESVRPNGLRIRKVRVPLGVIAMIYESRPNVTGDSAALCLKSSNAVILRGGSEALNSNLAVAHYIREALADTAVPPDAVQVIDDTDREIVKHLVSMKGLVDVVIPRGSEAMINAVSSASLVPVIGHGKGLCHIYVDSSADPEKAVEITRNAKVQRPGVCNAVETLLIHSEAAEKILPEICRRLREDSVELVGDEKARKICPEMGEAADEDWSTEYLSLKLSVKVVGSLEEAVDHIERYGSRHSDCIIAEDTCACDNFLRSVDSSCVYANASTRFTDGAQMGLGAEIGISNQKLHARGPMGLTELTTYKYHMLGNGQIRR